METRRDLRQRITELEEQNDELLDVIENIGVLAQEAVEEEGEGEQTEPDSGDED